MVALYFDIHLKDRRKAVSLIRKLQFSELAQKLHPDMRMQHPQKISDDTRIRRMQGLQFKYFNEDGHFVLKPGDRPPVQLSLKYQQIFKKENELHIYLDEKALAQVPQTKDGKTVIRLSVTDKGGVHRFEHQDDLLTEGVWGVHLAFRAANRRKNKLLQNPEKIVLTVGPARGPNDRVSEQPVNDYTFVPGRIEW